MNNISESKILWTVLLINFGFFLIEIITGIFVNSMSLIADSLDMLADAAVYGIALWVVGKSDQRKKQTAVFSANFQFSLALIGLMEVVRRFIVSDNIPDYRAMIVVSLFALVANIVCLKLLQKLKSGEPHIKASMIFTSNDVIINSGVIVAGVLVLMTHSRIPDLTIGSIIFVIVIRGVFKILNQDK